MRTALKYGIFVGIGSFLWMMLEFWLGYRTREFNIHLLTSLFSVIVLIAGIVAAIYAEKSQSRSKYGLKQGLATGLVVSLAAGVIMVFGQYLYMSFIDTGYSRRAQTWGTYIQVVDGVNPEEAKAETAAGAWKHNMHVRALGQIPLFLVQGAVISLIATLIITRKTRS